MWISTAGTPGKPKTKSLSPVHYPGFVLLSSLEQHQDCSGGSSGRGSGYNSTAVAGGKFYFAYVVRSGSDFQAVVFVAAVSIMSTV